MITDKLRDFYELHCTSVLAETNREFERIADLIDFEHEAENGWVRLPVDADGVPICVGDVMDKGKVTCIRNCGNGWEVVLNSLYTYDAPSLHHREPTVEDVLREMMRDAACQFNDDGSCCVGLTDKQLAEYAQKLQLRED